MDTLYFNRKANTFSSKCSEQVEKNDGRVKRSAFNPSTGETKDVWEFQQNSFRGLPESFYIEEGKFGDQLRLGLTTDSAVIVLSWNLFTQKGTLNSDIVSIAKKVGGIDFSKTLEVGVWENTDAARTVGGKTHVPSYTTFSQDNGVRFSNVKSQFEYDQESKSYKGLPDVEVTEKFGKKNYDSTKRDEFLFNLLKTVIEQNAEQLRANRELREPTENEKRAAASTQPQSAPQVPSEPTNSTPNPDDIPADVPF